jgi:hypothetical protein
MQRFQMTDGEYKTLYDTLEGEMRRSGILGIPLNSSRSKGLLDEVVTRVIDRLPALTEGISSSSLRHCIRARGQRINYNHRRRVSIRVPTSDPNPSYSSSHQLIIAPTHHRTNSSSHQLIIAPTHHRTNSSSHQLIIAPTHQPHHRGISTLPLLRNGMHGCDSLRPLTKSKEAMIKGKNKGVLQIYASYKVLSSWVSRYELLLNRRWTKKSNKQRRDALLKASPTLSAAHRPDSAAYWEKKDVDSEDIRDAYLLPHLNLADLQQPVSFCILELSSHLVTSLAKIIAIFALVRLQEFSNQEDSTDLS